jgi:uncharacterized protein DUF648/IQ calmodulin-binding motif-containing protein
MNEISFLTPITFHNDLRSPSLLLLETVDSYFYLGGKKVTIIPGFTKGNAEGGHLAEGSSPSFLETALKVASYFTLVLPIILLIVKGILRSTSHFYLIRQEQIVPVDTDPLKLLSSPTLDSTPDVKNNGLIKAKELEKELAEQKELAATKIQQAWRGYIARRAFKTLRTAAKLEAKKPGAATDIQRIWRGYYARVKVSKMRRHILSYALFEKGKPYIDAPSTLKDLPGIIHGKTSVYFPKNLPIVLKWTGSPQNQERFDKMRQARDICEQSCYQDLVIPKARLYQTFIIENKLPLEMKGTKRQMGLYFEHREKFTKAVREFTGFLCQCTLSDITGGNHDPYGIFSESPIGRYDNVVLYFEDGQGKIGLVDLEEFKPGCTKQEYYYRCKTAIHLFPLHLNEIMEAVKHFAPDIENYREVYEKVRDEAFKRFKLAYQDHREFLKEKGIGLENPLKVVEVSPSRIEEIKKAVVTDLYKECHRLWYENCLGEKPEEAIALFESSFPKIFELATSLLSRNSQNEFTSIEELISFRTVCFDYGQSFYDVFLKKIGLELDMIKADEFDKPFIADRIIRVIFKELAKGREIAYYNPSFGYGSYATQCVFY